MRLLWTPLAIMRHRQIYDYLATNFGRRSAIKYIKDVAKIEKMLIKNPFIGSREKLLDDNNIEYRSLNINDINKIVYYIDKQNIYIVSIWNMRRNPEYLAKDI